MPEASGFRIADDLARLLVNHAYLGQLDLNPVVAPGGKGRLKQCAFWAQKVKDDGRGADWLRIEGKSDAAGASRGEGGDGRLWEHEVTLVWEGLIEVKRERMTRLLLLAHGSEKLRWGNKGDVFADPIDVARLPAGHAIDLACKVRYGFIGEPISADEATDAPVPRPEGARAEGPEEQARRGLIQSFGADFLVYRAKVQNELRPSDAQKKKLSERLDETLQDAMQFFQKLEELEPEERKKKLGPFRQKVQQKLAAFLKANLNSEQLVRLRQIKLQQQSLFALGHPEVQKELKITDKQRMQFMEVVDAMDKRIRPLMKEVQAGGKPEEIGPKVMKIRKAHEAKVEAILTAAQKKKWQERLGKPCDPGE